MIAADTNLFLYALNADAPEREKARAFLDANQDNPDFVLSPSHVVQARRPPPQPGRPAPPTGCRRRRGHRAALPPPSYVAAHRPRSQGDGRRSGRLRSSAISPAAGSSTLVWRSPCGGTVSPICYAQRQAFRRIRLSVGLGPVELIDAGSVPWKSGAYKSGSPRRLDALFAAHVGTLRVSVPYKLGTLCNDAAPVPRERVRPQVSVPYKSGSPCDRARRGRSDARAGVSVPYKSGSPLQQLPTGTTRTTSSPGFSPL